MAERRGAGFGPTVLAGLATSALAAVACARTWYAVPVTDAGTFAPIEGLVDAAGGDYPAASAASLVLLASWGVLLVTRGRLRRGFAVVAAIAALATLGTVVAGYLSLRGSEVQGFDELMGRGGGEAEFTGWFWTAAVAALLAVPPALVAVRRVGEWPEMGERYDAPAGRGPGTGPGTSPGTGPGTGAGSGDVPAADPDTRLPGGGATEPGDRGARDAWRELDEGRDPTDRD